MTSQVMSGIHVRNRFKICHVRFVHLVMSRLDPTIRANFVGIEQHLEGEQVRGPAHVVNPGPGGKLEEGGREEKRK